MYPDAGRGREGARSLSWKLLISNRAKKDLRRLDQQSQAKVHAALKQIAESDEGDIKRLANVNPSEWRLRVGDVRIRFPYVEEDDVILVLRVLPRGKAYDR